MDLIEIGLILLAVIIAIVSFVYYGYADWGDVCQEYYPTDYVCESIGNKTAYCYPTKLKVIGCNV